eukprot:8689786-Pyramimonas_sp.AAC.1
MAGCRPNRAQYGDTSLQSLHDVKQAPPYAASGFNGSSALSTHAHYQISAFRLKDCLRGVALNAPSPSEYSTVAGANCIQH